MSAAPAPSPPRSLPQLADPQEVGAADVIRKAWREMWIKRYVAAASSGRSVADIAQEAMCAARERSEAKALVP